MSAWRRHPMVAPGIALALGASTAWLFDATLGPSPRWTLGDAHEIAIARPHALWLLPIAVAPFLLVTALRSLVDLRRGQVVAQTVARLSLLLALALALAEPSLSAPIRGKTVVLVLDASASVDDEQLAEAEALAQLALAQAGDESDLPREDRTRLHVVAYGDGAWTPAIQAHGPAMALRSEHRTLASDHAAGLALADALIDPHTDARILLVTDGTGDLGERESLAEAARALDARGVTIHTRSVLASERGDVLVESVFVPDQVRAGQPFEVAIDVVSSGSGPARIFLDVDGSPNPLAPHIDLELRSGSQQVRFPVRVTRTGPVVFLARVDTTGSGIEDRTSANDRAAAVADVRGRPRVLLVGSDSTRALARALVADNLQVEEMSAAVVPSSAEGLAPYDLMIVSDVPARAIPTAAQQAISAWVKDSGGGFIMVGGESSFGLGAWESTPLAEILPVRFGGERQREQPTLALVLVIDKSGSMSSQDKLDLVKEAARATARTLDPSDELGVIAFDSQPQVLVRLQPAANRLKISSSIRKLTAGGGTNALPALREGFLQLAGSKALVKHVILLSDGQSPETGMGALLGDMRDADITVSAVGVGSGSGKDFLARVAERGRGRYYFSQDGTDVPRIFSRETQEVTRNAVVERQFFARVVKPIQALRGLDFERAPGLRGLVPVEPKPQAELILRTQQGDALLVRGRRGLGRTVAFASDAEPRWAAAWIAWGGFAKFWSQIARDSMRPDAGSIGGASIEVLPAIDRGAWRVVVDVVSPSGFANQLQGSVEILDPSKPEGDPTRTQSVELVLSAPGRYEAQVDGVESGQRLIRARMIDPDDGRLAAEAVTQVSVPYPPELSPTSRAGDPGWLAALASERGTSEGPIDDIIGAPGDPRGRTRERPLWPQVLWMLAIPLLIVDLALRRVSLGVRKATL